MSHHDSQIKNLNRRRFLQGTASVAAVGMGSSLFSHTALADDGEHWQSLQHDKHSKRFWRDVQHQFVLDKRTTYMNVGTTGSMPKHVLKAYNKNNQRIAKDPWDLGGRFGEWPHMTEMINDIAAGFGAEPYELTLSRNTTDGLCSIINGLNFQPGDVILTTHHEHIAATSPLQVVKERFGVEIVEVQLPVYTGSESVTADDYVDAFRDALNAHSNVRLLTFSHITYKTGTTLPAKRLCELAKSYAVPTLVDGAHTVGMLAVDLHDMDCDFFAGSGHKWQCGAGATGILYVRDNAQRLAEYWSDRDTPLWFINSSLASSSDSGTQLPLQYVGNDNYPAKQALVDSCKMWDDIGRKRIENRVLALKRLCQSRLKNAMPDAYFFSPEENELASAITTFNPFALDDGERLTEYRDRLREDYGYIIRTTDFKLHKDDTNKAYALRISTHLFHDEDDVKGLVRAMHALYKQMK